MKVESSGWCMEWIGSQKDFIAGKAKEGISLERFAGVENLYAAGPVEQGRGEVSIFDSTPLISKVNEATVNVTVGYGYRAGFFVYAIVENWRRATVRIPIENEDRLGEQLLPLAVENGIDIDRPFPFLVYCYIAPAPRGFYAAQLQFPYACANPGQPAGWASRICSLETISDSMRARSWKHF